MPVPKRSRSAARTSASSRRSWWTMSSLEIVAAPCRAKACKASVLPAPILPVIATATGRMKLLLGGFARRGRWFAFGVARSRLVGRLGVGLDALVDHLGRHVARFGRCRLGGLTPRGLRGFGLRRIYGLGGRGLHWCICRRLHWFVCRGFHRFGCRRL